MDSLSHNGFVHCLSLNSFTVQNVKKLTGILRLALLLTLKFDIFTAVSTLYFISSVTPQLCLHNHYSSLDFHLIQVLLFAFYF